MKLEELQVYNLAMDVAERIWSIVIEWDYFIKKTVGGQFVEAIDSVAANLSEGFGRYFYKENKQFCYYSRGSLFESKTWLRKSFNRKLIDEKTYLELSQELETIGVKLNNYIKSIGKTKSDNE
jgi:four helix bundle protein